LAQGSAGLERVGDRLTLVGTMHVDPKGALFVRDSILRLRPEVVALELDRSRLLALENPGSSKAAGSLGPSYLGLALLERFAGQLTGSAPGTEMLRAVEAAGQIGARVELIDLPISATVEGLRSLPMKEKVRIAVDSVAGIVALPFGRPGLQGLTENVQEQLVTFRSRYPGLSRLLLDRREEHMVSRLQGILDASTGLVVGVVGFGHLAGLKKGLAGYESKAGFTSSYTWTQPL
jgi:pheromone shutdown protein TraB